MKNNRNSFSISYKKDYTSRPIINNFAIDTKRAYFQNEIRD